MTKNQIQKKYNCLIYSDNIDGFRFYQAYPNNKNNSMFESASGWSLVELIENINENLIK